MALIAARVTKAAADNLDFVDIKLSIPCLGETRMARAGVRRRQLETGSREPLKIGAHPSSTRQCEPAGDLYGFALA
jgi:hypothetical protein